MFPDMTKMFDPSQASQMMQSMQKMWDSSVVEAQAETTKKLASIWGETFAACYQQQATMAQQAMQTSVECLKDMSSCKGMEEMMAKQAAWAEKSSKTCQVSAQSIASTVQRGYQQASETITKAVSSSMKTSATSSSTKN